MKMDITSSSLYVDLHTSSRSANYKKFLLDFPFFSVYDQTSVFLSMTRQRLHGNTFLEQKEACDGSLLASV